MGSGRCRPWIGARSSPVLQQLRTQGRFSRILRTRSTVRVADVHAFPDHIACDARSRSELVVPFFDMTGDLRGVLDVDSPSLDAFSAHEAEVLEHILREAFGRREVVW